MRHLKSLLFGIILLSFFGSAFADEYDPGQDVFDQIINALVPTLIVFLNFKEVDEKKLINILNDNPINVDESGDVGKRGWKKQLESKINKIRQVLLPVKIKRAFDDFLFLLSLFVLPSIVFHKNHEIFTTPLWISILSGVTAGTVFIITIFSYIFWHKNHSPNSSFALIFWIPILINFCHILSDICFLFYTRSLPMGKFTDGFIYAHAVTGILGAIFMLGMIIFHLVYRIHERKSFLNDVYFLVGDFLFYTCGTFLVPITLLWTPIIQMLNMALLSGNDYYWTKSILAINLIYISRVLYYAVDKKFRMIDDENLKAEMFGLLNTIYCANYCSYKEVMKMILNN